MSTMNRISQQGTCKNLVLGFKQSLYEHSSAEIKMDASQFSRKSFYIRYTLPTRMYAKSLFIPFQTDHKSTNNFWEEFTYI